VKLVARLAVGLVTAAAALPVPSCLDGPAARWATRLIALYRRRLSRHSGRWCLFRPTCSQRAATLLAVHGWRAGLPLVRRQLRRCSGDYALLRTSDGGIELVTADGARFPAEDTAEWLLGACDVPATMAESHASRRAPTERSSV
jgi:putative component of membrane protein insertase Oxa1/YidC/SpoIIIJ protein YidD